MVVLRLLITLFGLLYHRLIEARSKGGEDARRREFILNVFLTSGLILSLVALVKNQYSIAFFGDQYVAAAPYVMQIVFLIFVSLVLLSRAGFFREISYSVVLVYLVGAGYTIYAWGVEVPQGVLTVALAVVLSGVLIGTKFSLAVLVLASIFLISIYYLQVEGVVVPDRYWVEDPARLSDVIVFVFTLGIIGVASWLSNREIDKSLSRARSSEAALKDERDHLEETVADRTRELRRTQMEKMLHLYRFAEFGKLASGVLHDFVNPLTTVSLNLQQLEGRGQLTQRGSVDFVTAVQRAMSGTRQMERFVEAAQRQIRLQSEQREFSVGDEIQLTIDMLIHRAREAEVKLVFDRQEEVSMHGDPIQLNQLVTNLAGNAIDSYKGVERTPAERRVVVTLKRDKEHVIVAVQDWGCGIPSENMKKIFEPLFTTKQRSEGIGLGLSICRGILEDVFKGHVDIASEVGRGTTFTVTLPMKPELAADGVVRLRDTAS